MAVNLGPLSNFPSSAPALGNLILVNPQKNIGILPQNDPVTPGITPPSNNNDSFLFNYEGEQTITLESDITDHYIEDNTAIQDQIALRPELITTQGFIAELNDIVPEFLAPLQAASEKLNTISAYTPGLSATAISAVNKAFQSYQAATLLTNAAISAWSTITGSNPPVQNKQQVAFQKLYGYWQNRTLFTVQTPWRIFENVAIKSLRAIQDAETNVISNFEVTFKVLKFTSSIASGGIQLGQGRFNNQAGSTTLLGTSTPVSGPSLLSSSLVG